MTASDLLARQGGPGTRETIALADGIQATLLYDLKGRTFKLVLPGFGRDGTRDYIDKILLDLFPMSARGEKLSWSLKEMGGRIRLISYEHFTFSEREGSSVWVYFNNRLPKHPLPDDISFMSQDSQ